MTAYERSKMWRDVTERNGVQGKECVYCGIWKPLVGGYTKGPYAGYDHRCRECKQVKRIERETRASVIDDTPRQAGYAMLRYEGAEIAFEMDRTQASLTDLWIAAGRIPSQEPKHWLNQDGTRALLMKYAEQSNVMLDYVCTAKQGSHGGTWAPREIALAYAMYLNPALHLAVLRFVLERSDGFIASAQPTDTTLLKQLIAPIYQRLGMLDLLPGIDASTRAAAVALAGAEQIRVKEYHRGRIYIGLLIDPITVQSVARELIDVPSDALIVFIGQTKPGEGQECLRIRDYSSKVLKMRPEYYELLTAFDTDNPNDAEGLLLANPPHGAMRATTIDRKRSQSFHVCTPDALAGYKQLTHPYYAAAELQASWAITSRGPMQAGLWG